VAADLVEALLGSLVCVSVIGLDRVGVGGGGDREVEGGGLAGGVRGGVGAWDGEAARVGDGGEDAVDWFSAIGGRGVAATPGGLAVGAGAVKVA
jgi:hypothetical protein